MNISIPAGGEKPPTKEPLKDTNPSTTREPTQTEERANLECPVKDIKDHTTESHRSYRRSSPYKDSYQSETSGCAETNKKSHLKWGDKKRTCNQKE